MLHDDHLVEVHLAIIVRVLPLRIISRNFRGGSTTIVPIHMRNLVDLRLHDVEALKQANRMRYSIKVRDIDQCR